MNCVYVSGDVSLSYTSSGQATTCGTPGLKKNIIQIYIRKCSSINRITLWKTI